jgi:SAM-dependent methyltransferase
MVEEPWHADEGFWEAFQEFMFPPEKDEEATEQIDELHDLIDLEPNERVLDVPCGIGRHTVELAERGFDVTAVDATAAYLETARERAENADVEVAFVNEDMREFQQRESFDLVCNLYTSFGYFADRDDDERTARNFHESLKPGGTLVMDLASKELLARDFEKRTWDERDGAYVLEEHHVTDNWTWMANRWIIIHDGETREFEVSHRLYSAAELTGLLERVGFDEVTVYGSFAGSDYDETAERLVVVARK